MAVLCVAQHRARAAVRRGPRDDLARAVLPAGVGVALGPAAPRAHHAVGLPQTVTAKVLRRCARAAAHLVSGSPRRHRLVGPSGLHRQHAGGWAPRSSIKQQQPPRLGGGIERALVFSLFPRSPPAQPPRPPATSWCGGCVGTAEYVWSVAVQLRARPIQRCPSVDLKIQPTLLNGSERTPAVPRRDYESKLHPTVPRRRREYSADPPVLFAVASAPLATSSRTTPNLPFSAA
jgi:hypothetical protein